MGTTSYESIKVYDEDYDRAKAIRADRGLDLIECVGAALEAWQYLPRPVQDRVVRERVGRKHGDAPSPPSGVREPVAAAS